ncbi:hypothetical protein [Demequina sp.]|uniref:hypothetical protein n=1 Tax=Demequina sp. TaxID=2050685 RepID=UPI003D0CE9B8
MSSDNTHGEFTEPIPEPMIGSVTASPVTPVAPSPAAPSGGRPTDVVVVTLLALIAGAGDVIQGVAWLVANDSIDGAQAWFAWASLLIGLATVAVAALLFQGSTVARTLIAIVMLLHIGVHIVAWIAIGSNAAVAAMIQLLISGVVLLMLFSRETTAYLQGAKK